MPWPIMYWKEGYKGFHSDCALNHAGFRALALIPLWCRAMHPILNYVEFRTNHEPNMVHGVVDGEMHFQLVIIDGLVKNHISYVVHASTKPVLSEPSTLRPFDRLTAQGERFFRMS